MKIRLYFDTSIFGGVFDEEFEEISTLLFEKVNIGQIVCVYSDLTIAELKNAPKKVRDFFESIPKDKMEFVAVTKEVFELADKYLDEKVVGKTSTDDCRQIATATINKVDYLIYPQKVTS
jgi:hypothetical protein